MAKSILPVVAMAAVIGIVGVAAVGATSNSKHTEASLARVAVKPTPTPTPMPEWRVPHGATANDAMAMLEWIGHNDQCRGSSDEATINRECPKRDATEKRLAARGWCFDYPDKPASDAEWHRCSRDAAPKQAAAPSRVDTIKAQLEPYYAAAVEAQVVTICGLRSGEWAGRITRNVNVINDQIAQRLSEAERTEMGNWQRSLQSRIQSHMVPGGSYTAIKCGDIASSRLPAQIDAIDWELTGGYQ